MIVIVDGFYSYKGERPTLSGAPPWSMSEMGIIALGFPASCESLVLRSSNIVIHMWKWGKGSIGFEVRNIMAPVLSSTVARIGRYSWVRSVGQRVGIGSDSSSSPSFPSFLSSPICPLLSFLLWLVPLPLLSFSSSHLSRTCGSQSISPTNLEHSKFVLKWPFCHCF